MVVVRHLLPVFHVHLLPKDELFHHENLSFCDFRLRNQQEDEKKKRDDFDREGRHKLRELEREARYGGRDRGGYRDRDSDRDRGRDRYSAKERETEEKEKEAVRERYLGGVKKKKKVSLEEICNRAINIQP